MSLQSRCGLGHALPCHNPEGHRSSPSRESNESLGICRDIWIWMERGNSLTIQMKPDPAPVGRAKTSHAWLNISSARGRPLEYIRTPVIH
jgi:hypothetical protein